jgi:hypothetical protein
MLPAEREIADMLKPSFDARAAVAGEVACGFAVGTCRLDDDVEFATDMGGVVGVTRREGGGAVVEGGEDGCGCACEGDAGALALRSCVGASSCGVSCA